MNLMNNGQLTGLIKLIFCPLVFKKMVMAKMKIARAK